MFDPRTLKVYPNAEYKRLDRVYLEPNVMGAGSEETTAPALQGEVRFDMPPADSGKTDKPILLKTFQAD